MFMKLDYGGLSRRAAMTRCAFAKAFCADRSRFMRCAVAGFMPEDLPNNSRDAASVIDAVRAVVRTRPAGRPRAAARSAGGRFSKFVVGGGGGARGPCTAARNASSWSLSAAASSASFSAATARRRFFSFFRSIDLDDSGSIDARELQNALRSANIANLPPWDMGRLIAAIDIDGDGQINLPELDITVARLRSASSEEE